MLRYIHRKSYIVLFAVVGAILVILLAAAVIYYRQAAAPPAPSKVQGSIAVPSLDHVVVIVEENKPASTVMGNPAAPYINKLARDYAEATNYRAITHPSLPNYIAMTSGATGGITNDCNPPGPDCQANVSSIADEIERAGKSWKMYAEGMPEPCHLSNAGRYAVKHVPFAYYPATRNGTKRCQERIVPLDQLAGDLKSEKSLPNYVFVSPDLCSDMHDCSIKTGDDWLARQVPHILRSPAFTNQHSLLVLTWDEGSRSDNHIPTIFAGSAAKTDFKSNIRYDHYSLLHTIEKAWKLAPLTGNDGSAPIMSDMLR